MRSRYTIYRYSPEHFAIDCEDCNVKLANLKVDSDTAELLDRINTHERTVHNET